MCLFVDIPAYRGKDRERETGRGREKKKEGATHEGERWGEIKKETAGRGRDREGGRQRN